MVRRRVIFFDPMGVDLIDPARHPLIHVAAQGAQWVGTDDYPAFPEWVDIHERWFRVVHAAGGWDHYLPRLRMQKERRDEAIAEIAAAYFAIDRCGLRVLEWEPQGSGNRRGEFLLGLAEGTGVFTEVKSPGWEEEVVQAEGRGSPRLQQPKYINGEGKWVDAVTPVRATVAKAYPKFPDTRPTLLIINDDLKPRLNDSLILVKYGLYSPKVVGGNGYQVEDGCFVGCEYERLGAIGILDTDMLAGAMDPDFRNPNALPAVALPRSAFDKYPSFDGLG